MAGKRKRRVNYGGGSKKRKTRATGPVAFPKSGGLPTLDRAVYAKSICVYSDVGRNIDPGLSSTGVNVYSLNGLYDPDITNIGGQPTGFDEYMSLYNQYTVLKAKVSVSVINSDTTISQLMGLNISSTATTSSDANVYLRNNNKFFKILDKNGNGTGIVNYSFEVDIAKLAARNIWTDDAYSGTASSNPSEQWYLHCWNIAADGSTNATPCVWTVKIEYLIAFRKVRDTANS